MVASIALAAFVAGLLLVSTPAPVTAPEGDTARARVLSVDNGLVHTAGMLKYGSQRLQVEVLSGALKGRKVAAANELRAQLELDKEFVPGDTALVVVRPDDAKDPHPVLVARDHWRLGTVALLFAAFGAVLALFGGWIGVKALLSFAVSCLAIWKGLIPLVLLGWSASLTAFAFVAALTLVIMYLVAGVTRTAWIASLGALLGVFAGLGLSHVVGALLRVNGATMPFVQALLYSGYARLDLPDVFIAASILACSGAVMDLAMDIASGVGEVARRRPDLSRRELWRSGVRIGRNVVGTMSTTLLLAYSGGFLTLLMAFSAQGISPMNLVNTPLVAAEIAKTLCGSLALLLVAPSTAFVAAWGFGKRSRDDRDACKILREEKS